MKRERAKLRHLRVALKAARDVAEMATHPSIMVGRTWARPEGTPAKFVQCWPINRGGYNSITQALDEDGRVWERVSKVESVNGVKTLVDSWWIPLSMDRRAADLVATEVTA